MRMRSRRGALLAAGTAALTLAACGTGGSSSSPGGFQTGPGVDASAKTIALGVLTPLTGAAQLIGVPLTAGQQAYFKYVDANGGIDGWKINLTVEDNQYPSATKEVQDYNQMVGSVLFFAQSLGSPTTQAIEQQAETQKVLIGTAAQDSAFVTHDINAVIGTPYAVDVANAMTYVAEHNPGAKIGIIYQNDAYGQDGLKGYTAAKAAVHFDDVGSATYDAATDTTPQTLLPAALAMKNAGAQYVMLTAIPTAAAGIIGSAAAVGYHPQWILQGPAWSEYLMTSGSGAGTAAGTPTPVYPALLNQWVLGYEAAWGDTTAPGMAKFLQIQHQYSPSQIPDGYYVYGYCLAEMEAQVLAKAIAGHDLTRQGVLNAKLHLGAVDFGGLIPNANYTSSLGPADRETEIATISATSPGFLKVTVPYFSSSTAQSMSFG